MIVRDKYGIIGQHRPHDSSYFDTGDSARSMGIMACFGSKDAQDIIDTHWFRSVRHPYDSRWNRLDQQSRDQQVCLMAGAYAKSIDCARKVCDFTGARVNKDILMPDVYLFMRKCLGKDRWYHYVLGYPFLIMSILYTCLVDTKHELNQIACICRVMGTKWLRLLVWLHPDYADNMHKYWGGWRDQAEIGDYVVFSTFDILQGKKL